MDRAGEKLKRVRERLKLTYRDVERASQELAGRRGSKEFLVPLSRLADIENRGTVPSIYRLYTLCAVYRLDLDEVMRWYGVPADQLPTEALQIGLDETHTVQIKARGPAPDASAPEQELDWSKTAFLSQWGKAPLSFLNSAGSRPCRYGLIGLEDWSMYPILRPGSLVVIDESRRKIASGGWTNEFDRPIYFFEHRTGFLCGWSTLDGDRLLILPHPSAQRPPSLFRYPVEIDVIGQVVGVAMTLGSDKRRQPRPPATQIKANAATAR
jgi:transcriptional regulator with XRE-family HTH domain